MEAFFIFRHLSDLQTPLTAMLHPRVTTLPGHIQGIFVQNVVKLFSRILIKANSEVCLFNRFL